MPMTNRPGISTSNMCQRHVHICTLQARWMTFVSLTVSWNTWRGVLRTPFIILLLLTRRFLNLNPLHNALAPTQHTSNSSQPPRFSSRRHNHSNRWPLLPTWQTIIPPENISRFVSAKWCYDTKKLVNVGRRRVVFRHGMGQYNRS